MGRQSITSGCSTSFGMFTPVDHVYIYTWPEHDAFDLLLLSYDHMIIDHNEGLTITII